MTVTIFADAHLSYKEKRCELRLAANNLLGKDKFERRTIGTTANCRSVYRLRLREVMLTVSLDL